MLRRSIIATAVVSGLLVPSPCWSTPLEYLEFRAAQNWTYDGYPYDGWYPSHSIGIGAELSVVYPASVNIGFELRQIEGQIRSSYDSPDHGQKRFRHIALPLLIMLNSNRASYGFGIGLGPRADILLDTWSSQCDCEVEGFRALSMGYSFATRLHAYLGRVSVTSTLRYNHSNRLWRSNEEGSYFALRGQLESLELWFGVGLRVSPSFLE